MTANRLTKQCKHCLFLDFTKVRDRDLNNVTYYELRSRINVSRRRRFSDSMNKNHGRIRNRKFSCIKGQWNLSIKTVYVNLHLSQSTCLLMN